MNYLEPNSPETTYPYLSYAGLMILGTIVVSMATRYLVNQYGLVVADKTLDGYITLRNKVREIHGNIKYDCHDHHHNNFVSKIIKINNIHLRWFKLGKMVQKQCFEVNQMLDGENHQFTMASLGLKLSETGSEDSTLGSTNQVANSLDDSGPNYVLLDIFYEYSQKDYLVTVRLDRTKLDEVTFDLDPGKSGGSIEFSTGKFYDGSGQELSLNDETRFRLLKRVNEYMGPRGDFHQKLTKMRLEDLYFPEVPENEGCHLISKMVLETDLTETLEVSDGQVLSIDDLL